MHSIQGISLSQQDTQALGHSHYLSAGGVRVQRSTVALPYGSAIAQLRDRLDKERGVLLSSSFEFPGRYNRWDVGFVNPPIAITARGRTMEIEALNARGRILLPELARALVAESSILRAITQHFFSDKDIHLGLYGAFAYDLTFQFEAVQLRQERDPNTRDLVLYLPDEIIKVDHHAGVARCHSYEFVCRRSDQADSETPGETTGGLRRRGNSNPFLRGALTAAHCDHGSGEYAAIVRKAKEYFRRGDTAP